MVYEDIIYEAEDGIAVISINRPKKMNAARYETHEELLDALNRSDSDDGVRAVIITGMGRAFCSGTDISSGEFGTGSGRRWNGDPGTGEGCSPDAGAVAPLRIYDMRKPVIGAVNGAAVGFGASLLCSMDVRLVSDTARVGFVYAKRGICNESCSSWFLPRIVGVSRAVEWVATGRLIAASELKVSGFAREIYAVDALLPAAKALGREVAEYTSPAAVAVSRHLMWRNLSVQHPRIASGYECRGLAGLINGPDAKEGIAAFVEKRAPRFTSRAREDTLFLNAWEEQS